jgi:hypothetical protein
MDPRANHFHPYGGGEGGGGAHHPHFVYSTSGSSGSSSGYTPLNPSIPPALESTNYMGVSLAAKMYSGSGGVGGGGVADAYYGTATAYDYQGGDVGYRHHQSTMQQGPMAMVSVSYEMEHNGGVGGGMSTPTLPLKPGSFFPVESFQPQLNGAPISALAYDDTYNAIFVASASKSFSRGGGGAVTSATCGGGRWLNHRASTLVTHSTTDGMLYSCVAGHPEASAKVLNTLYGSLFVQGFTTGEKASVVRHPTMPPPHAYRPYLVLLILLFQMPKLAVATTAATKWASTCFYHWAKAMWRPSHQLVSVYIHMAGCKWRTCTWKACSTGRLIQIFGIEVTKEFIVLRRISL